MCVCTCAQYLMQPRLLLHYPSVPYCNMKSAKCIINIADHMIYDQSVGVFCNG